MDNQHRKINGYRELSQDEIDLMNEIKRVEAEVLAIHKKVDEHLARQQYYAFQDSNAAPEAVARLNAAEPARWNAIAKTHIQQGCMALVRAVAQPTT